MRIPRPADGGAILLQHRGRSTFRPDRERQFQQLGLRVDEQIDQRQMTQREIRLGDGSGCARLSSWRLLVGGLSPGVSHHSFTTSSEEPPLSNFNSYWDIP